MGYYLKQHTYDDLKKQLAINNACNFLVMFVFLDCMYYKWKICLVAWYGDFRG